MSGEPYSPTTSSDAPEPTLGALLSDVVRTGVPSRFYQLLHLGVPFGIQLAAMGWWRSAGWAFGAAAFGAWALAEGAVRRSIDPDRPTWSIRAVRLVSGASAAMITAVLLVELFVHLLGRSPVS